MLSDEPVDLKAVRNLGWATTPHAQEEIRRERVETLFGEQAADLARKSAEQGEILLAWR